MGAYVVIEQTHSFHSCDERRGYLPFASEMTGCASRIYLFLSGTEHRGKSQGNQKAGATEAPTFRIYSKHK